MISPEQEEVLRELDLVSHEQNDALDRVFPSVDIIANEQVILFARKSSELKNFEQIPKLAMNVAANLNRSLKFEKHWLRHEYLSGLETDCADFGLSQNGFFLIVLVQAIDDLINIEFLVFEHLSKFIIVDTL